jgi:hypothetical protein
MAGSGRRRSGLVLHGRQPRPPTPGGRRDGGCSGAMSTQRRDCVGTGIGTISIPRYSESTCTRYDPKPRGENHGQSSSLFTLEGIRRAQQVPDLNAKYARPHGMPRDKSRLHAGPRQHPRGRPPLRKLSSGSNPAEFEPLPNGVIASPC